MDDPPEWPKLGEQILINTMSGEEKEGEVGRYHVVEDYDDDQILIGTLGDDEEELWRAGWKGGIYRVDFTPDNSYINLPYVKNRFEWNAEGKKWLYLHNTPQPSQWPSSSDEEEGNIGRSSCLDFRFTTYLLANGRQHWGMY